jgi:hypothetical protein
VRIRVCDVTFIASRAPLIGTYQRRAFPDSEGIGIRRTPPTSPAAISIQRSVKHASGTVMTIDTPTEAGQEPVVSRDTAISCLVRLGMQSGIEMAVGAIPSRSVLDGDSLSVSRLVEIAGEAGLRLDRARLDWQGLQTTGFSYPILARLKNTNVVVLTGGGRNGAEEIAVWDPLDRDEEVIFVPRVEFEQAWSGDALIIAPQPSSGVEGSPNSWVSEGAVAADTRGKISPATDAIAQEKIPPAPVSEVPPSSPASVRRVHAPRRLSNTGLWLASAAILMTSGLGVFLLMRPADDKVAAVSIPAREASERPHEQSGPPTAAAPTTGAVASIPSAEPAPTAVPPPPTPTPEQAPGLGAPASGTRLSKAAPIASATPPAGTPEPNVAVTTPAADASVADPTPAAEIMPPVPTPEPSSTAAAAAPATASAGFGLASAEITALVARGDASLGTGDVATARLYYRRAAEAGDGEAAIRLGETFDPGFLEQAHLRSARGDLETALSWYRHARDLGVPEAEVLLKTREAK